MNNKDRIKNLIENGCEYREYKPNPGIYVHKKGKNIEIFKKRGKKLDLIERILNIDYDKAIKKISKIHENLPSYKYFFRIDGDELILEWYKIKNKIIDEGENFDKLCEKFNFKQYKWNRLENKDFVINEKLNYSIKIKEENGENKIEKYTNEINENENKFQENIDLFLIDFLELFEEDKQWIKKFNNNSTIFYEPDKFYLEIICELFNKYTLLKENNWHSLNLEIPDYVHKMNKKLITNKNTLNKILENDKNAHLFYVLLNQLRYTLKKPFGILNQNFVNEWNRLVETIDFLSGYSKKEKEKELAIVQSRSQKEENSPIEIKTLFLNQFYNIYGKTEKTDENEDYAVLILQLPFSTKIIGSYIEEAKNKHKNIIVINKMITDDPMYMGMENSILKEFSKKYSIDIINTKHIELSILEQSDIKPGWIYYEDRDLDKLIKIYCNYWNCKSVFVRTKKEEVKKMIEKNDFNKFNKNAHIINRKYWQNFLNLFSKSTS